MPGSDDLQWAEKMFVTFAGFRASNRVEDAAKR